MDSWVADRRMFVRHMAKRGWLARFAFLFGGDTVLLVGMSNERMAALITLGGF